MSLYDLAVFVSPTLPPTILSLVHPILATCPQGFTSRQSLALGTLPMSHLPWILGKFTRTLSEVFIHFSEAFLSLYTYPQNCPSLLCFSPQCFSPSNILSTLLVCMYLTCPSPPWKLLQGFLSVFHQCIPISLEQVLGYPEVNRSNEVTTCVA